MNSTPPAPPRGRWIAWAAVALVLGALAVQHAHKASQGDGRGAFARWGPQIRALVEQQQDVYASHLFPNPPFTALVLYPYCLLSAPWGALAWFVTKCIMLLFACRWVFQLLIEGNAFPPALICAGLLWVPIVGDLQHGNINIAVLFFVAWFVKLQAEERDFQAGAALAIATALKLTPALLILYSAYKRRWRCVAASLAILTICWVVLPIGVLGWPHGLELGLSWIERIVLPFARDGVVDTQVINQSLPALWYRFTTSIPPAPWDQIATRPVQLIHLSPEAARWGMRGATLATLFVLALVCRVPSTPMRQDRQRTRGLVYEVSLVLIAALWISERSWKQHYVTMLPAVAVLAVSFCEAAAHSARRRALGVLLSVYGLCFLATSPHAMNWWAGPLGDKQAEALGVCWWGSLLAAAGVARLLAAPAPLQPPRNLPTIEIAA